ncbi:MAG TPA: hypothetical protein VN829_08435 [Dongiaceae bacterium]|nr:hypothetical protein [Dongiaceae bacterium]
MKTNKTLQIIGSAALAVLVIHPLAIPLHAGVAVSIGQNFTGSSRDLTENPSGAANADYFVELSQQNFTVYNKADGSVAQALDNGAFWSSTGLSFPGGVYGAGPRLVYDPTVQRWFAAESLAGSSDPTAGRVRVAVSATSDPTGVWNGVTFPENPGNTSRFLTVIVGLDAQGIYLSSVVSPTNSSANGPPGTALWSLPKTDLLAIPPIITNRTWFGFLDPTNHGYALEPAICFDGSAGGDMLATGSNGVDPITGNPVTNNTLVASAIQNAGGPGPATLSGPQSLLVPPYTEPINFVLQPDGSANLEDWDATFSANVYRVGDVLFATDALQDGPRVAVRWYRISAINHTLLESGTITDPSLDFYFPSIAANTDGTVVPAFNGSGSNAFVSCYAMVGQTVNGVTTFGNLLLLQAGLASYQNPDTSGFSGWGAYSTTCADPTDPNVFWTINAYAAGPTTAATQITQLLTSPSPPLTVANNGSSLTFSWPVTAVPFQLESTQDLGASATWSPVTPAGTTNGTTVSVSVPVSGPQTFFRLTATP